MLVQQDTIQFNGFGQGDLAGKYFFSSGFKRTENGASPAWRINQYGSPDIEQYWFAELNGQVYSVGDDGDIFIDGTEVHAVSASKGNGLILDQKNRLLYARQQYLGKNDGGTYTDDWKNFGVSISEFRPMELFEDMVLIGNRNKVAALFTSDDSFTDAAFTLPSSFTIRAIKAGKTGILIAANIGNRGYLILWDGNSLRSIAPWIYVPELIYSLTTDDSGNFIVTTRSGFLLTNGYSIAPYAKFPVKEEWSSSSSSGFERGIVLPGGTAFKDGKLFVAYTPENPIAKTPLGVFVFDSATQLWEHIGHPNGYQIEGTVGALFLDSSLTLKVSYSTEDGTPAYYVGDIEEKSPSKAVLITKELGQGNNPKYAEALIANIRFSPTGSIRYSIQDWTVTAKIYDFKRQLYGFGLTNGVSATANTIKNTGNNSAYQSAQVGDEITILNGNNASEVRHITAIANAGTNTETWTLDSALPNLTASGVNILIMPFKTIGTKSITESGDYFFNIKNRLKGKHYLIKYIFETDNEDTMIAELTGSSFVYDDNPTQ
jgi:hypothetical protein